MGNTASNVTAGKPRTAGAVFVAPAGTTLPTDASTALAETYTCLGYVSEDGLEVERSADNTPVKEWGGATVAVLENGFEESYHLTLIETMNADVLKAVFGAANVTGALATGIKVSVKPEEHAASVWVFDMILRGGVLKRIVVPNGVISEIGATTYSGSDVTGYEITIMAMLDSTGCTSYEHLKTPTTSSGSGG